MDKRAVESHAQLDAATSVTMRANCYLHGFITHQFGDASASALSLSVRARQFSGFVLLVGRLAGMAGTWAPVSRLC